MASLQYSRVTTMYQAIKNYVQTSLKLSNSVMAMTGIAILMYSVWMIIVCLRDYQEYPLPWFLWACICTGTIFNFTACIGHVGAVTCNNVLLYLYAAFMLFVMLVESLITADICINDHWYEDFPKDRTERFRDFVDYVHNYDDNFRNLGLLIAFSQVTSTLLALVLRKMQHNPPAPQYFEDEEAKLPFLGHQVQHPCPLPYAVSDFDHHYYPPLPYAYG